MLDLLYEIEGEYILSGHHNYPHEATRYSEDVKEITGHYPVVWGSDFSYAFGGRDPQEARQDMINKAKEMYEKGHIITLMWHACPPSEGDSCSSDSIWVWDKGPTSEEWEELTTPGTELNKQWRTQVDHVAEFLLQLQKEDIPVLWRPYHEMNGIWFWWCDKKGEDGIIKLWKMMYDRMVNHHNINNLIWVWNPNAPRDIPGDEAYAYRHYFPGLEYVDVLAADVYHNDYRKSHHDDLLKLAKDKPIAFGEVGKLPGPEVIHNQPQWTWFMGWANWLHKANTKDSVRMLYNDPKVVTLDEITRQDDGSYKIQTEE